MATRKDNGSGTFFYDEKRDRWVATSQWTDKRNNRHRKSFTGKKKTKVKNKLDEFKAQLSIANGNISNDNTLFKDYAEIWMNTIQKNQLKPTSYSRKELTLNKQVYPYIGDIPISQLTHNDIQNVINELNSQGFSYSTIKKAYEAISGCIKQYRIKNASVFNPCEGISLPINKQKETSSIIFFNDEQMKKIKDEATRKHGNDCPVYRLGDAIVLLMYSGMRIGELLALTWDDIDFTNKTISISKNAVVVKEKIDGVNRYNLKTQNNTKTVSGQRIIPMTQNAYDSLKNIYEINGDKQYVMSSKNNRQITPRNINRMFHSILTQTGIAKSPNELCGVHALRHTFASMLFKNGCDVKVVSELLGHSDTKITENIYIHVIQEQKIKAIQDIDKYSS